MFCRIPKVAFGLSTQEHILIGQWKWTADNPYRKGYTKLVNIAVRTYRFITLMVTYEGVQWIP
jgi:hypothetical protein